MSKVKIDAGICGFITVVNAESEDGQFVKLDIKSGCPDIKELSNDLKNESIDSFREMECHSFGKGRDIPLLIQKFIRKVPFIFIAVIVLSQQVL